MILLLVFQDCSTPRSTCSWDYQQWNWSDYREYEPCLIGYQKQCWGDSIDHWSTWDFFKHFWWHSYSNRTWNYFLSNLKGLLWHLFPRSNWLRKHLQSHLPHSLWQSANWRQYIWVLGSVSLLLFYTWRTLELSWSRHESWFGSWSNSCQLHLQKYLLPSNDLFINGRYQDEDACSWHRGVSSKHQEIPGCWKQRSSKGWSK